MTVMTKRFTTAAARTLMLLAYAGWTGLIAATDRRPYKKVAREQSQQRTRDALLDAADEELYNDRLQRASLDELSRKAGVTKQTLLRHFGSRDGLIEAAIGRTTEIVRRERGRAPVGDVPGAVENLMDHYERWGGLVMRVLAEEHRIPLVRKMTDHGRQVHYDWVDYAFAPQLADLDEQTRLRRRATLIVLCDVHTWWLYSHDLGLERSEISAILTDLIERLLADGDGDAR
jgi:AcrR family transcriptional regulator